MKEQFAALLSKYEDTLSDFKRKRRYAYISDEDYLEYNAHIDRLNDMADMIRARLLHFESEENAKRVQDLIDEYANISDVHQELMDSIGEEIKHIDRATWYAKNFENWRDMPERQDCDDYPLLDRLRYSTCRRVMFNHLENVWKHETFPTLADRLEFF